MFSNFYFDSIIGRNHDENQDSISCFYNNDVFFACVCDGIGSTKGSAIASNIFTSTFKKLSTNIESNQISELYLRRWFDLLLHEINNEFSQVIERHPEYNKMSTTACLYIFYKNEVFWFNIGDSRLYLYSFKENKIHLKTRDHTLRNYFANNNISDVDHKYIPYLDSLVNSVTYRVKNKMQNYDFGNFIVEKNDIIIISSDGAYKFCKFEKLDFNNQYSSKEWVNKIIKLSIYNGSYDDISVGVIKC